MMPHTSFYIPKRTRRDRADLSRGFARALANTELRNWLYPYDGLRGYQEYMVLFFAVCDFTVTGANRQPILEDPFAVSALFVSIVAAHSTMVRTDEIYRDSEMSDLDIFSNKIYAGASSLAAVVRREFHVKWPLVISETAKQFAMMIVAGNALREVDTTKSCQIMYSILTDTDALCSQSI